MEDCIRNIVLKHLTERLHTNSQESFGHKIIDVLANYHNDKATNVTRLSGLLELNERTLRRMCTELFRMTPTELIIESRLLHAEQLLKQNHKVSDVWHLVGFSSHSYFSDIFKKHKNLTPQAYLKQFGKGKY